MKSVQSERIVSMGLGRSGSRESGREYKMAGVID